MEGTGIWEGKRLPKREGVGQDRLLLALLPGWGGKRWRQGKELRMANESPNGSFGAGLPPTAVIPKRPEPWGGVQ